MGDAGAAPMTGVEAGGDVVVATYPVFLHSAPDAGGALYLLQSPLRPADRPYALEECDEVRFKARGGRRGRVGALSALPDQRTQARRQGGMEHAASNAPPGSAAAARAPAARTASPAWLRAAAAGCRVPPVRSKTEGHYSG